MSLTIGNGPTSTYSFIMPARTFVAGKRYIYNVTVKINSAPALNDAFTINESGTQVYFAPGNLQATWDGSEWTWGFAEHQWDYIGKAPGNTKVTDSSPYISENGTVDLFGWVGASSTWMGVAQYGITSSTRTNNTNGYGNSAYEGLKSDWGNTINDGYSWRTLTSDEWEYIFYNRTTSSTVFGTPHARYAHATINTDGTSVNGMILFPDGVNVDDSEVTVPGSINVVSNWGTKCTSAQWASLAAKGCVFLPPAGCRDDNSVVWDNGEGGHYWSSTPRTGSVSCASRVYFYKHGLVTSGYGDRNSGLAVRLVRPAE